MTAEPGSAALSPDTVPKPRMEARVRNVRGKTLLAVGDQAFELSETATVIWKAIDGKRTVSDVAGVLAGEYEIDEQTALADVMELVTTLASARLLDW